MVSADMSTAQKAGLLGFTGVTSLAFGIPSIVIGVQWMGETCAFISHEMCH